MFHMLVTPDQMARDDFINILTCFKCYALESHPTKNCQETKILCSECGQEGHRWSECRNPTKMCLNCKGPHRTLAMACPIKKDLINKKRTEKEEQEGREERRARRKRRKKSEKEEKKEEQEGREKEEVGEE